MIFLLVFFIGQTAWAASFELEEPDYAFITNSPYTENKKFLQLILTNLFESFNDPGNSEKDFFNALRFEYGFTDRLEGDLVIQFDNAWDQGNTNGFDDTLVGIRYRFLTEDTAPLTLAFGPQVIFPSGNYRDGFGLGGWGLAWDLTIAKEWNSLIFTYFGFNYKTTFGSKDPTPGSNQHFLLQNFSGSTALGFRPFEKANAKGGHHDIHVTLEFGANWGQSVDAGTIQGMKITDSTYVVVPGMKYGYLTKNKTLTEVGLAGVFGLNSNSPDWGIILQTQFEYGFTKNK